MEAGYDCFMAFLASEMVVVSLTIDIFPSHCLLHGTCIRPQDNFLLFIQDNNVAESLFSKVKGGHCSSVCSGYGIHLSV